MESLIVLFLSCAVLFLTSCQNSSTLSEHYQAKVQNHQDLFIDSLFPIASPNNIETAQEIFSLDEQMIRMVENKLKNNLPAHQKANILLEHLFNQEHIALGYDAHANITASEAYHSKQANCMSLTILAYALATAANMDVEFQSVDVPEYWVRNGQYNLLTGHVNLIVKDDPERARNILWGQKVTQIDFDPYVAKKKFSTRVIKRTTLLAMFYNNKGAEALINKNYSVAYQYFKAASIEDHKLASTWGNLGILYKLSDQPIMAEKAYRHAMSLNSKNLTSLGNLALLLKSQNRAVEANKIETYLHGIRLENPYYHALLGHEALLDAKLKQAIYHYKNAIKLDNHQHEFYSALAKVYVYANEPVLAQKNMKIAIKLSGKDKVKKQYIAKLNFLNLASGIPR